MSCDFTATDRDGIAVACYHDAWENHIADEHPEMASQQGAVATTIRDPVFIYQSDRHASRKIFYRPFILSPPYFQSYLRVVIEYRGTGTNRRGTVVTAFPSANIRQGDILIWSKYEATPPEESRSPN